MNNIKIEKRKGTLRGDILPEGEVIPLMSDVLYKKVRPSGSSSEYLQHGFDRALSAQPSWKNKLCFINQSHKGIRRIQKDSHISYTKFVKLGFIFIQLR